MTDLRSTIALTLDLHTHEVTRELVECRCGWLTKRGPGAQDRRNRHLEDELVAAILSTEVPEPTPEPPPAPRRVCDPHDPEDA